MNIEIENQSVDRSELQKYIDDNKFGNLFASIIGGGKPLAVLTAEKIGVDLNDERINALAEQMPLMIEEAKIIDKDVAILRIIMKKGEEGEPQNISRGEFENLKTKIENLVELLVQLGFSMEEIVQNK